MKFRDNEFFKIFNDLRDNPKTGFHIVLFDILFIVSINVLYWLVSFLIITDVTKINAGLAIMYLVLTIVYYLVLVFIYAFFKYNIMKSIKSLYGEKSKENLSLKKFYMFNLIIFVIFFATTFTLNSIFLLSAVEELRPFVFMILNVPLFLIGYILINISHSKFFLKSEKKLAIIKKSFNSFLALKNYFFVFIYDLILIIIYFIIFYVIGWILRTTIFTGQSAAVRYSWYEASFVVVSVVFFYLLLYINRIYFYKRIKDASS